MGKHETALEGADDCLARRRDALAPLIDHPDIADSLFTLAEATRAAGHPRAALRIYDECHQVKYDHSAPSPLRAPHNPLTFSCLPPHLLHMVRCGVDCIRWNTAPTPTRARPRWAWRCAAWTRARGLCPPRAWCRPWPATRHCKRRSACPRTQRYPAYLPACSPAYVVCLARLLVCAPGAPDTLSHRLSS
jgi:hypothetical protein